MIVVVFVVKWIRSWVLSSYLLNSVDANVPSRSLRDYIPLTLCPCGTYSLVRLACYVGFMTGIISASISLLILLLHYDPITTLT